MNWQRFKSGGDPIYLMQKRGDDCELFRLNRVIHNSQQFGEGTKFSVRYNNRWQPLHSADNLAPTFKDDRGNSRKVRLDGHPWRDTDQPRPFICDWDEPGHFYEVFGY